MIPEISEQGLDSRKETVLQSEPMKQTTEEMFCCYNKKTEMGKSKTETEPTESSRLMRGAWEAQKEYILELCTEFKVGCNGVAHVIEA